MTAHNNYPLTRHIQMWDFLYEARKWPTVISAHVVRRPKHRRDCAICGRVIYGAQLRVALLDAAEVNVAYVCPDTECAGDDPKVTAELARDRAALEASYRLARAILGGAV